MFSLPRQPKIIKKEKNKAVFEIEALYPGYGVTVGNSLRRVLLSSLTGAAVTQVKIKGISHEFSTIPGVLEDVILIILNLKQLRFKVFTDEPQKVFLKVKGEKKIKGTDFSLPSQVELVNKDCYIATLTSKSAELEMEIQIEKGIGYSSREARKKTAARTQEKLEIGVISLDATFTPIKTVSYKIENMRVGERTDYDRLFLEIETDGIITPEEAFCQASEILVNHFSMFKDTFKIAPPKIIADEKVAPIKRKKKTKTKIVKQSKRTSSSSSSSFSQTKTRYEKKKKRKKIK